MLIEAKKSVVIWIHSKFRTDFPNLGKKYSLVKLSVHKIFIFKSRAVYEWQAGVVVTKCKVSLYNNDTLKTCKFILYLIVPFVINKYTIFKFQSMQFHESFVPIYRLLITRGRTTQCSLHLSDYSIYQLI